MTRVVYLDHHATTPVDPLVFEAMKPFHLDQFGNPASRNHRWGWDAEAAVTEARASIASNLGARAEEIVFTSGATEAINLALLGLAGSRPDRDHIVATAVEHRAVLDTLAALAGRGIRVEILPVDGYGRVTAAQVAAALTPRTLAVVAMLANNEIGTIQPIGPIASVCKDSGAVLISDACQAVGHIPVDLRTLGVDLMPFSAHKFYGPKGVGALYIREGLRLEPTSFGGGHERGLRPGTLNVPGIVGMACALERAVRGLGAESLRVAALRDRLERGLMDAIPASRVNGDPDHRLPHNLNMSFEDVEAESVLIAISEIALSTGSACTSAKLAPSHVLKAIGLSDDLVHGSIRFGLGRSTSIEDVDYTVRRLTGEIARMRALSPSWAARTRSLAREDGFARAGYREPAAGGVAAVAGRR